VAGDWIKWTKGLARKSEVLQIACRLGRSRHEVASILMEVWEWADDNAVIEESVSGFDPDDCPGTVRLGTDPALTFDAIFAVSGLADAMTAVGWIAIRSGSLVFPNLGRHNGKSAKSRALDTARKQAKRATSSSEQSPPVSGFKPDKKRTREEKRREEQRKNPLPPQAGVECEPALEGFDEFRKAYPAKWSGDMDTALRAWRELAPDLPMVAEILAGLAAWGASDQWQTGRIEKPAKFLRSRQWLSKPAGARSPPRETPSEIVERLAREFQNKQPGVQV
jgi:hypothetical protein